MRPTAVASVLAGILSVAAQGCAGPSLAAGMPEAAPASAASSSRQGRPREIIGRVLIDDTGEPLAEVSVFFEGYRTPVVTDSLGNFAIVVPLTGDVVLIARRIGYQTVQTPIRMDAGPNQVPLVIRLKSLAQVEEEWRARLMRPTSVTPCRSYDWRATSEADAIQRFLNSGHATRDSLIQALGLARFIGASPEHLIDTALCRRAAEAINVTLGDIGRATQVHLFRLGGAGFAAHDPSIPAGEWQITHFLDQQLRVITGVVW